ncbi:hypothetical protein [Dasania marina]|uniref:hypothetical protein n=1 Tax=Dasania marina TaxID=471499 RepID=UPI0030DBB88A|tara:strand:+ start:4966 stop:5346 length:381 start_codon:yes stop_codon:yes gene_type:complete
MARPRYTIQPADIAAARSYLLSKLNDDAYEVNPPGPADFIRYLTGIDLADADEHEAHILNRWCETCLSSEQWKRLKLAIRQKRIDYKMIKIPITKHSHAILQSVINEGNANTLSDAIEWLGGSKEK